MDYFMSLAWEPGEIKKKKEKKRAVSENALLFQIH